MANMYFKGSRLTDEQSRTLVWCFAEDMTAISTAKVVDIDVRSVNPMFQRIRERITEFGDFAISAPAVQVGTFRLGPRALNGKHGLGADRKTIALVIFS